MPAFCFLCLFAFRSKRFSPVQCHAPELLYLQLCWYRSAFVGQSGERLFSRWRTSTVVVNHDIPCSSRSDVIRSNQSSNTKLCSSCTCINIRILVWKVGYLELFLEIISPCWLCLQTAGIVSFWANKIRKSFDANYSWNHVHYFLTSLPAATSYFIGTFTFDSLFASAIANYSLAQNTFLRASNNGLPQAG